MQVWAFERILRRPRAAGGAGLALAILVMAAGTTLWRQGVQAAVLRADPQAILAQPGLRGLALARGRQVYANHCMACHGEAGKGDQARGAPDLTDQDHLYGTGQVAEIETIARYGIRAHNKRGWDLALMPAFGAAHPSTTSSEQLPSLSPTQIEDLTQFLLSLTGRETDKAAATRGGVAFGSTAACWDCHGHDAGGDPAIGAPNLTDDIWLYGGSHDAIYRTVAYGRAGYSPAYARVLKAAQLRDVAVYVASLAQPSAPAHPSP